jgi:hypothetical protein
MAPGWHPNHTTPHSNYRFQNKWLHGRLDGCAQEAAADREKYAGPGLVVPPDLGHTAPGKQLFDTLVQASAKAAATRAAAVF